MPKFFSKYSHVTFDHKSDMNPIFGLLMLWANRTCFSESRFYIDASHTSKLHPL